MNTTEQTTRFLQVLAGEASEAEVEERYLAFARLLMQVERDQPRAA